MSAIKKWFEDKKRDKKFARLGPGQRLSDSNPRPSGGFASAPAPPPRHEPTTSAVKAGAAALARFERTQEEQSRPTRARAFRALRTEAEVQLEVQQEVQEQQLAVERFSEPVVICADAAPVLAVKGVYFTCPLVSPESLPWDEWKPRIREFLVEQMGQDTALCAAIALRTLNPAARADECAQTIEKYIGNVLENPAEQKYRRIRLGNPVFQQRVHPACESALDFLLACGFRRGEEFLELSDEADLAALRSALDCLLTAEGIEPVLDRCTCLLEISQGSAASTANRMALPGDFFSLTAEELDLERLRLRQTAESEEMLKTRQMRERERCREHRRYRYALVRVRLPGGGGRLLLQGTFAAEERPADVYAWLRDECLDGGGGGGCAFHLVSPDKRERLAEADERSLADLGLCPAAVLALMPVGDPAAAAAACRLRQSLAALKQPLV